MPFAAETPPRSDLDSADRGAASSPNTNTGSAPRQTRVSRLKEIAIVVPTYREAENLPLLLKRIESTLSAHPWRYEVVIVDDNSQDGTVEAVEAMAAAGRKVRLIVRKNERGLSSAVVHGFRDVAQRVDTLVCMDADLSHEPESLPALLKELEENDADFVIGSRYVPGATMHEEWNLFRFLNSRIATLLALPFTSARDPMSGFFALRSSTFLQATDLNPCGYKIGLELIVKCNCRNVRETPINFSTRKFGESKLTAKEQLNYLRHVRRLLCHKHPTTGQLLNFLAVGLTGVFIDLPTYLVLLSVGTPVAPARGVAIFGAMTWNWWLNRCLTFGHSRASSKPLPQYGRYLLTNSIGALISWSVSVGLTHLSGDMGKGLLAKAGIAMLGIACGTAFNFTMSKLWVFRSRSS